jgi:hypothetical protein
LVAESTVDQRVAGRPSVHEELEVVEPDCALACQQAAHGQNPSIRVKWQGDPVLGPVRGPGHDPVAHVVDVEHTVRTIDA